MTFTPEITMGDIISAASLLIAALALFLTLYQLRREAVRKHVEFSVSALTAQLDTLIQIQAMPDDRRHAAWAAIASAPGGPGQDFPIERAIAIQIQCLDSLAQGEELTTIPTYGRGKSNRRVA